jgi:hypothetical protein
MTNQVWSEISGSARLACEFFRIDREQFMSLRRHRLFIGLALALSFIAAAFRAVETLPTQLSDSAFWKMVTDMSEPDGNFRFENFLSNELKYQTVIPRLLQNAGSGGVYMGVAPEQNFTYIAALKPKMAFIIDIRRQNMIELLMYKAFFEMSDSRADFLSRLFARKRPGGVDDRSSASQLFAAYSGVMPDPDLYKENLLAAKDLLVKTHRFGLRPQDVNGDLSMEYVYSVFVTGGPKMDFTTTGRRRATGDNPSYADLMSVDDGTGQNRSFLATEENYRVVRDLQRKNLIVPLVGDFSGPKTIRAVGRYVRDRGAIVKAFYLSNVEQYLFEDKKAVNFYDNVATLPLDSTSTFIRTFSGSRDGGGFAGGGYRFESMLSPMTDLLKEFKNGRLREYEDVRKLSK